MGYPPHMMAANMRIQQSQSRPPPIPQQLHQVHQQQQQQQQAGVRFL